MRYFCKTNLMSEPSDNEKVIKVFNGLSSYEIEKDGVVLYVRKDPSLSEAYYIEARIPTLLKHNISLIGLSLGTLFMYEKGIFSTSNSIIQWKSYICMFKGILERPDKKVVVQSTKFYNGDMWINYGQYTLSKEETKIVVETLIDIFEGWLNIAEQAIRGVITKAARC